MKTHYAGGESEEERTPCGLYAVEHKTSFRMSTVTCKRCLRDLAPKFTGISLEKKWKEKHESETFEGNKSGGQFMRTVIDYKGQNRF